MKHKAAACGGVDHFVHLYHLEAARTKVVSEWAASALRHGSGALVISTRVHGDAARADLASLGIDVARAEAASRLVIVDADALLARILVEGELDPASFHRVVGGLLDDLRAATGAQIVRASGEMVDLLVKRGRPDTAHRLKGSGTRRSTPRTRSCSAPTTSQALMSSSGLAS